MATEAQTITNRANAQKSTGPRTPEGKAVAAQNAVKHGLLAQEVVIKGEDARAFALYREGMLTELAPAGQVESMLAERIVGLSWRLRRAERLQGAAVGTLAEEKKKWVWSQEDNQYVVLQAARPGSAALGSEEEALAVDRRIAQDFAQTRIFDRLLVYERRIEHSLYRTMAELRNLRKEKGAPSLKCEVSGVKLESPASSPVDLPTSHSLLLASGGTPDGDTANVWEAASELCETNPICVGARGTGILPVNLNHGWDGDPKREETRLGTLAHAIGPEAEGQLCKTNPISQEVSGLAYREPNESCKTNPISQEVSSSKCQVASKSCKTNPISASPVERQVPRGTGVTSDLARDEPGETKPISTGASHGQAGYRPIFRRRG